MKKFSYILFVAVLFFAACDNPRGGTQGEVLARVGDKELTAEQVKSLLPESMLAADSVKMLEQYIDMWVRKQLKVKQAEAIFHETNRDIEAKVEEYRNTLLIRKLEEYYLDKLDTLYTQDEIEEYYQRNKNNFTLDRTIVKGRVLKLQDNSRRKKEFKALMNAVGEKHAELVSLAEKNKIELTEFTDWVDFSRFLTYLPADKIKNTDDLLDKREVHEVREKSTLYLIYVTEYRKEGDVSPLVMVDEIVKRVIYNQRKQELLKRYEDSLYHNAASGKILEIKQIDNSIE